MILQIQISLLSGSINPQLLRFSRSQQPSRWLSGIHPLILQIGLPH